MSITMYDSIDVSSLPRGAEAYAGYVGGFWPTYDSLPSATYKLSIAINAGEQAECLDVEAGDATIAQVYSWYQAQVARGIKCPVIYTSASNVAALNATMQANGFKRNQYQVWSAHYTGIYHICAPGVCGYPQADATQYTDAGPNGCDVSACADYFFAAINATPPAPKPVPAPVVTPPMEDDVQIPAQPANAPTIATGVSFNGTPYKTIGFVADPGVEGGGTVTVRCAFHIADAGFTVTEVSMNPTVPKSVVTVPQNCDGVSFTRLDNMNIVLVPNFAA